MPLTHCRCLVYSRCQGPYLAEKVMAQLETESEEARHSNEVEVQPLNTSEASNHGSTEIGDDDSHTTTTHNTTDSLSALEHSTCTPEHGRPQHGNLARHRSIQTSSVHPSLLLSALYSKMQLLLRAVQGHNWLRTRWGSALAAAARPLSTYGVRLHLALFYVWGVYYQLPLRLLSIRFASTAQPL